MSKRLRLAAVMSGLAVIPIAVGVAALGCGGGGAEGGCAATNTCGGNVAGFWQVRGQCSYAPPAPAQPLNYIQYIAKPPDPMISPPQPLPTTDGDWCSGLYYGGPGAIITVTLWHDVPTVASGTVAFDVGGSYKTNLVMTTPSATHFSGACIQKAGGINPSCSQLQTDLTAFFGAPNRAKFNNITCTATPADQGCDCKYVYEVDVSDQGTYFISSTGTLVEVTNTYTYDGTPVMEYQPQAPTVADYCITGGVLQMSGDNGTSLSGVLGLRRLTLLPATPPPPSGDGGP